MINIFVIDDHPVYIDGLKSVFNNGADKIKVTGWATSAKEALPKLKRSRAKVVLLDLIMPEISGVEFCLVIKNKFPEKKVIALTGELNPTILYNAWINKADAIIMKYCEKEELVETIYDVLTGKRITGEDVPDFNDLLRDTDTKSPRLTPSEQQVLNLLAQGHSREETAKILGSSTNAVHFHCKNMFKKFKKNNITSVIEEAKKRGLIT